MAKPFFIAMYTVKLCALLYGQQNGTFTVKVYSQSFFWKEKQLCGIKYCLETFLILLVTAFSLADKLLLLCDKGLCISSPLINILMRTWTELSMNLFSFQNLLILILWYSWDLALCSVTARMLQIIPPVCRKHHVHPSSFLSHAASWEPQPLARSIIAVLVDSSRPAEAHPAGEDQPQWVLTALPSVSFLPVSLPLKFFLSNVIDGLELSHRDSPVERK